mgnify:FL=1
MKGLLTRAKAPESGAKETENQTAEEGTPFFSKSAEYIKQRTNEVGESLGALFEKGQKFGRQSIEGARMLRWLSQEEKEPEIKSGEGRKFSDYFTGRSKDQNAEAKKFGPWAEQHIRNLGERYNSWGWKKKLAIGAFLGIIAAASSSVSPLLFGLATAGLSVQRFAGMAGMYTKIEKHLQETAEGKSDGFFASKEWYRKLAEEIPEKQRKILAALLAAEY